MLRKILSNNWCGKKVIIKKPGVLSSGALFSFVSSCWEQPGSGVAERELSGSDSEALFGRSYGLV